ncbi:unnamed protein product [Prorocentrum cordatum]|uniref:Uncharacterized protein n=1 Tax=Prorocentrum cordatum TaxID=2364126 RepID=A0ABN9UPV5_9DINO|nr:unnamed protein product [Polarella glacialis]
MLDGCFEGAARCFTDALRLKPGLPDALASRGVCLLSLGHTAEARADFAEVIAQDDAGFNRNIYVLMATCFKRDGDYQSAMRYLSRCIGHFATFAPALLARGELCLRARDFERASRDFRRVLQQAPAHLVARRGLGDALRGLGNFGEALDQYSWAVRVALRAVRCGRGQAAPPPAGELCLGSAGPASAEAPEGARPGSAADESAALWLGGSSATTLHLRGDADEEAEDAGSIVVYSDDGGESRPDAELVREVASVATGEDGSCESSAALLPEADLRLAVEPFASPEQVRAFAADALLRRALLRRLAGDRAGAGSDLTELIRMEPCNGLAYFWRGLVLLEERRHSEAHSFLEASILHHEETRAPAHALLGALAMVAQRPQWQAGLGHLQEATRLQPSSQPARATLCICRAAALLRGPPPCDAAGALALLDRALALSGPPTLGSARAALAAPTPRCGQHAAGSGGAAAASLARAGAQSPEEACAAAARAVARRRDELARGDDLQGALECRTFLDLVAQGPQLQSALEAPPLLRALRAEALVELARWEEALSDCRKVLAADPHEQATKVLMHMAGGAMRSRADQFDAAVVCFTKALRLRPDYVQARLQRAAALACAARARGCSAEGPRSSAAKDASGAGQLRDAVQDLQAVEELQGPSGTPASAQLLRAVCLTCVGSPDEACGLLEASGERGSPQCLVLQARALFCAGRQAEAIEKCGLAIRVGSPEQWQARLLRAWAMSGRGEFDRALEEVRAAIALEPDRNDVHEAGGDMLMRRSCLAEAAATFGAAERLHGAPAARLAYKGALCAVGLGRVGPALRGLTRALRLSPGTQVLVQARDGVLGLEALVNGSYSHARIRFTSLLNTTDCAPNAAGRGATVEGLTVPSLFRPHELLLFRGACWLYEGDAEAAEGDFVAALQLARELAEQDAAGTGHATEELPRLEREAAYNLALCRLLAGDFHGALGYSQALLELRVPPSAACLAWFLAGACHLLISGGDEEAARDAFARSYQHGPIYVDDFLRRHGRADDPAAVMRAGVGPVATWPPLPRAAGTDRKARLLRPVRESARRRRPPAVQAVQAGQDGQVCDAAPEAVCCLRREGPALGEGLPPCRVQAQGVVLWCRPSVPWPRAAAAERAPLEALQQWGLDAAWQLGDELRQAGLASGGRP